jgi:hypothetical protein
MWRGGKGNIGRAEDGRIGQWGCEWENGVDKTFGGSVIV